jgi:hypothetical protein
LKAGRAERHGFEYYRHGTLSLYAALNVKTGSVEGKTAPRHTNTEFVGFLTALLRKAKWAREIHIVLDNLSAHKTQAVEQFLAGPSQSTASLHSNLFIVAQSGRDLGLQKSSATSLPAECSLLCPTFAAN